MISGIDNEWMPGPGSDGLGSPSSGKCLIQLLQEPIRGYPCKVLEPFQLSAFSSERIEMVNGLVYSGEP